MFLSNLRNATTSQLLFLITLFVCTKTAYSKHFRYRGLFLTWCNVAFVGSKNFLENASRPSSPRFVLSWTGVQISDFLFLFISSLKIMPYVSCACGPCCPSDWVLYSSVCFCRMAQEKKFLPDTEVLGSEVESKAFEIVKHEAPSFCLVFLSSKKRLPEFWYSAA